MNSADTTEAQAAAARHVPRECATCHQLTVSFYQPLRMKNCPTCRDANRAKARLARERKLQRKAMYEKSRVDDGRLNWFESDDDNEEEEVENLVIHKPVAMSAPPLKAPKHKTKSQAHIQAHEEDSDNPGSLHVVSLSARVPTKSKAVSRAMAKARPLRDLEGDEKRVVLKQRKNQLVATVRTNIKSADSVPLVQGNDGREYQTASALYDSLKRRMQSHPTLIINKKLRFHGFHAIITMDGIDNAKRVEMVTNDLRKIARLPFDHKYPEMAYDFETRARITKFKCTCLGYEAPKPQPMTLNGNSGDLMKKARHAANTATPVQMPRACGGRVTITAVDDRTHPLRLVGQRIVVLVEHN